ncbi:MAG: DMT family transporter [Actinobacteria bacterium]|nr:DMT family transporter [Actinomycetota bacterium]
MGVLFGLLAAATYGVADFAGGRVSRRADVFSVVLISQLVGAVPLALVVPFLADHPATSAALGWGAAAGIGGGTGVLFLYRGLAVGRMSVVAPITGVVAASLPVVFGLAVGERPGAISLTGVVLALASVVLVSSTPPRETEEDVGLVDDIDDSWRRSGVPYAFAAGTGFGLFFVFLDAAGNDTGVWPLVATRVSSLVLVGMIALSLRRPVKPPTGTFVLMAVAGILDVAANVFYLISTRFGLLSLVAVLTSMYPAVTVLMARVFLKERMVKTQLVGLVLAGIAIGMIVLG